MFWAVALPVGRNLQSNSSTDGKSRIFVFATSFGQKQLITSQDLLHCMLTKHCSVSRVLQDSCELLQLSQLLKA